MTNNSSSKKKPIVVLQEHYEIPIKPMVMNMTVTAPREKSRLCQDCFTEGLVIMPVRKSHRLIKRTDEITTKVNRSLQPGYLYVFDNHNQILHYYNVSYEGYISYVGEAVVGKAQNPKDFMEKSCFKKSSHQGYASVIQIEDANKISEIWIGYSPTILSKKLAEIVSTDTSVRNKIMTKITPKQYNTTHISMIDAVTNQTLPLEYYGKLNPLTEKPYYPEKKHYLESLIKATETLTTDSNYPAVMVIIDDPIGEMVDLNEIMIEAKLASQPAEDEVYRHTVATLINTLKNNVDERAKAHAQRHIDKVNEHNNYLRPMPRWEGDGPSEAEQQAEAQRQREGASRFLEQQRQSAWSGYSELIRENEMNGWLSDFEARSEQRQNELNTLLEMLATAYKDVFKGEELKTMMTHCFDKDDEASCVYYTLTVQQFLGSTATIPMLANLYDLYLTEKKASDEDNYLARALTFNQDQVVNYIDGMPSLTAGFSTTEIMTNSWSGLLYTGSAAIFGRYDAVAGQVGATVSLAEQLAVPFMKDYRTGQALSGLMISTKEYLFGYHHEKALIVVRGEGSYADARKALINGVMHIAGSGNLPTRIRESIDQALKTSGEAARLNKTISQSFIYYIDKNQLRAGMNVYESSNKAYPDKNTLRQTIGQSVYTAPELYDQSYKNYKRFEDITNRRIDQAVRTHYFGAMLQTVACVFLVGAFFQAKTQQDRLVEGSKAVAGLMILLAGSLELRGNASQLMISELKLQRGAGVTNLNRQIDSAESTAKSLSRGARILSLGGAAIFAGFDIKSALDAEENDNETMMWAYYSSAATGAGSTVLLTLSLGATATGIGVVLLIGFIGVTLFIGYWKKSGMENWLNLGIWGVKSAGWSLEHTLEQFDRAVVGDDIDLQDN